MPWLQLKFTVPREQVDALTEALEEIGAQAVTLEAASGENLLQAAVEEAPRWERNSVTALFPADTDVATVSEALRARLGAAAPAPRAEPLSEQDWGRVWMAHFRPLRISERLWICPSWFAPPDPAAVNLLLDPGMSFGTGGHATTALCLEWLDRTVLPGQTLIDYGCGSGILAIAALRLGAAHALATDIDPQALAVTRENAARNGVLERLDTCLPDALPPAAGADIVIANILAGPLAELAPRLTALVHPGGHIALSGLLADERDMVLPHYRAAFDLEVRERDGWLLVAGRRR
jgi:ribosomal protein L11 methyltransferase